MEGIRFRCPQCTKLYQTDPKGFPSGNVEFRCQQCEAKFAIQTPVDPSLPEIPATLLESGDASTIQPIQQVPGDTYPCPECGFRNKKGSVDCGKCGVVFQKREALKGNLAEVEGSVSLQTYWQTVIDEYENMNRHEAFIQLAMQERNLPFASQQYRKILNVHPSDAISQKMIDRIIQLAMATFSAPKLDKGPKRSLKIQMILIGIGLTVTIVGIAMPPLKQLIAPGAAILLLGAGLLVVSMRK